MTDLSILCPTRGRPANVERMVASALDTAHDPDRVEIVLYVDQDDPAAVPQLPNTRIVTGPRIVLSQCWNACYEQATGEILMHAGDDIVFRSDGWDEKVRDAFEQVPDRIVFVHGDDGSPHGGGFGTHGFLHRAWPTTVGYFVPPHFVSDYADTWLNDVANALDRRIYLPDVQTEHLHPAWGKGDWDQTHRERLARHAAEDVEGLYLSLTSERARDVVALMTEIERVAALCV